MLQHTMKQSMWSPNFTFLISLLIPCYMGFTHTAISSFSRLQHTAFFQPSQSKFQSEPSQSFTHPKVRSISRSSTSTSLPMVWWFGGTDNSVEDDDSCELVAVRIERTSPNSRRIAGDITVEAPIDDVWAILTDYDNLSTHVPNLVESKRVQSRNANTNGSDSVQGDGSYSCRLFQRGAQKIVGFEFGASVTMDMVENIIVAGSKHSKRAHENEHHSTDMLFPEERKIGFKCVESAFFSEFDGEWKVVSDAENDQITTVSYVVDVRPRGPVPVAALEWRIREDVPTNLRAVKKASLESGLEGVLQLRAQQQQSGAVSRALAKVPRKSNSINSITTEMRPPLGATNNIIGKSKSTRDRRSRVQDIVNRLPRKLPNNNSARQMQPVPVSVVASTAQWDESETMAAYLNRK